MDSLDITFACDVTNPLLGPKGATYVFGPQKGVKESDKEPIDKLLGKLIGLMKEASDLGRDDVENEVGAGGRLDLGA